MKSDGDDVASTHQGPTRARRRPTVAHYGMADKTLKVAVLGHDGTVRAVSDVLAVICFVPGSTIRHKPM